MRTIATVTVCFATFLVTLFCTSVFSQMPGDGIPDLYHFSADGQVVDTSVGLLTRPVGTLILDTDGYDFIALLIEGPNLLSLPDNGDYLFGSSAFLPYGEGGISPYNHVEFGDISQWLRESPLGGQGFDGVIGEHPEDPLGIFPNHGLTRIEGLPTFEFGLVQLAANDGSVISFQFCDQVACVPEPCGLALCLVVCAFHFISRRRES